MTGLTTYRPKKGKYIGGSMDAVLGNLRVAENDGDVAEVIDALEHWVPDTRLQALADAWNAANTTLPMSRAWVHNAWPELADLLDALGEEADDG